MPEKATYSNADLRKSKTEDKPSPPLAETVAAEMNAMVAAGEDPAIYERPEDETVSEIDPEEEVDEVLEAAIARGYDPDYKGDDAKTLEEFTAYGEALDKKQKDERDDRELRDRLDRLEVDRRVLAESDASNFRQKIMDLSKLHKEAVEEGDYDRVTAIQKQLDETKTQLFKINNLTKANTSPRESTVGNIDREAQNIINDFEAANPWLDNGSDTDTQIAQTVFNKYLEDHPSLDQSEMVNGAIAAVKEKLPSRFKRVNKARAKPSDSVKSRGRTPKASQISEQNLSTEEMNAFKAFKRAGTYNTVQEFYADIAGAK